MEPPFEASKAAPASSTVPPKPHASAAAAPQSEVPTKRKGFLGSLSFKRSNKSKGESDPKAAAAAAAAVAAENAKQAAAMPAEAMAGVIDGCPLQSSYYAEAWKEMLKHGRRPKESRLYTSLDGVLGDPPSMSYFVNYLKSIDSLPLLKFFMGADRHMKSFGDKGVEEREKQATQLYQNYIVCGKVRLPNAIGAQVAKAAESCQYRATTFKEAAQHVRGILATEHFKNYQQSPFYSQYCISVLTSGTVFLEDMLYNESFLMGFIEFMTMEGVGGIIQFWLIADGFNDQLHSQGKNGKPTMSAEVAKGDATGIYKRFIALDAAEPLGVDARTRAEIEKMIANPGGPDKRCFLRSLHLAHTSLKRHFFPMYMQSDAFYQYLNSLVNAAKASDSAPPPKQVSANPDSAGNTSTDVASDDVDALKGRQLRRSASQLGLVDKWGVYIRDEDATNSLFNDTTQKGRVGKTITIGRKKNKKEQEQEMAVQVARMIITDVYREMKEQSTIDRHLLSSASTQVSVDPLGDLTSE